MKPVLLLCILLSTTIFSYAQVPALEWEREFSSNYGSTFFQTMAATKDGAFLLGAYSDSSRPSGDFTEPTNGGIDYTVLKVDENGDKIWDISLGGSADDIITAVGVNSANEYLFGGYSESGISGDKTEEKKGETDIWLVKTDSKGDILWDRTIGTIERDDVSVILPTDDGGYILGGRTSSGISGDKTSISYGDSDYWVIKIDKNGDIIWERTYGGSSDDYLSTIMSTEDGNFLIGGSSSSSISGVKTEANKSSYGDDYWVVKIDKNGDILWDKTYGGNSYDKLRTIVQTLEGNYVLGGYTYSSSSGDMKAASKGERDYWIIEIDTSGNLIWEKNIGGAADDLLTSILVLPNGEYYLFGGSSSEISADKTERLVQSAYEDSWLVKIDKNGNVLWDKTYGKEGITTWPGNIFPASDNSYVLGGHYNSDALWLRKTAYLGDDEDIIGFKVPEQFGYEEIDPINHTIKIKVNYGTDLAQLVPTIKLASTNASVYPESGTPVDFSATNSYTFTVEVNNSEIKWQVLIEELQTQYCEVYDNNSSYSIKEFVLGDFHNKSEGNQAYSDFTNLSINLQIGENYLLEVYTTPYPYGGSKHLSVFIDYNQNNEFDDNELVLSTLNYSSDNTYLSGDFNVLASAIKGKTRMRVVLNDNRNPSPCGYNQSGEVEDYTVNISDSGSSVNTSTININFQNADSPPVDGYLKDFGQSYANRNNGYSYGWMNKDKSAPLSLVGNGRNREKIGVNTLKNTLIHMQYGDVNGPDGIKK